MASGTAAPCTICGSTSFSPETESIRDFEYAAPGTYVYRRCDGCTVLRIDPVPAPGVLALAYPRDYHAYSEPRGPVGHWLKRRYWLRKALRYARLLSPRARVLDVGCGSGAFLEAMRSIGDFRLVGLDFSEEVVRQARARGFDAIQGELDAVIAAGDTFDLIVMTNVIEHFYNPLEALGLCSRMLAAGGYIVGETPNTDCWDRKFFGRYWGGYHVPRHIFLFSTKTLRRLAEQAGYEVMSVSNLLQPAHWALSIQNALADRRWIAVKGGRSRFYSALQLAAAPVNAVQALLSSTTSIEFIFQGNTSP